MKKRSAPLNYTRGRLFIDEELHGTLCLFCAQFEYLREIQTRSQDEFILLSILIILHLGEKNRW